MDIVTQSCRFRALVLLKILPMKDWIHQWDTGFVRSNYRTSVKNFDPYASEYDPEKKMNEGWF
jgi:hypothetical protein